MNYQKLHEEIAEELARAQFKFGAMASPHEGIAVVHEEFDELLKEVRDNKRLPEHYQYAMYEEAKQLAAMSLRFMIDCCPVRREPGPLLGGERV